MIDSHIASCDNNLLAFERELRETGQVDNFDLINNNTTTTNDDSKDHKNTLGNSLSLHHRNNNTTHNGSNSGYLLGDGVDAFGNQVVGGYTNSKKDNNNNNNNNASGGRQGRQSAKNSSNNNSNNTSSKHNTSIITNPSAHLVLKNGLMVAARITLPSDGSQQWILARIKSVNKDKSEVCLCTL